MHKTTARKGRRILRNFGAETMIFVQWKTKARAMQVANGDGIEGGLEALVALYVTASTAYCAML
jgi:hypothetical protein